MSRARVLLADDHAMVAQGLAGLLRDEFDLVGTVGDGRALIDAARQLRPDVIVADIAMPVLSGLEALRRLREEGTDARVIFLTMHADARLAGEAFRAGARGYVLKHAAGDELMRAVREVLQGRVYLTPLLAEDVLTAGSAPPPARLTPRQREVLALVAEGRTMKEVAAALHLSPRTVETHKYEMMQALGLHTTAELIRYALDHGLARGAGFTNLSQLHP
jgi:DNA-binding NarL/FixJ family response regulator